MRMAGIPAGRRMVIARGANDQLIVWSPLPGTPGRVSAIRALGEPAAFVIQSRFHDRFIPDYFRQFPAAQFLAPAGSIGDHPDWPLKELHSHNDLLAGFAFQEVAGMPKVREHVFLHPATKSLIIADLLFNLPVRGSWLERLLFAMADIGGKPRPSRLWRSMIKDRAAFTSSIRRIQSWDFDRILPGHGECVHANGKQVFAEAFDRWLHKV